jgi:hypothetical protein
MVSQPKNENKTRIRYGGVILNDESGDMWGIVVMAYFKVLSLQVL